MKVYCFRVPKTPDSEIAEFQICDMEHYKEKHESSINLRERLTEIIEQHHPIPSNKRDVMHKFYYMNYEDNLIQKMDEVHVAEYKKGSGGEMEPQKNKPAKMASIVSSSAMTFNILGNCAVTLKKNQWFANGKYSVQYEKQMYTLNKGSNPANLDALLINSDVREAVFCEMKMLEWLGKPKALKEAYLDPEYYFCTDAYKVFSRIVRSIMENKIIFRQYDAWQMFKHTLAIYNYTSFQNRESVNKKNASASMTGEFKKVTLANIVFEMDESLIADEALRKQYLAAVNTEREEAAEFIRSMLAPEHGLVDLFRRNCDVEFDIIYLPVREFVACMEKTETEKRMLRRYC